MKRPTRPPVDMSAKAIIVREVGSAAKTVGRIKEDIRRLPRSPRLDVVIDKMESAIDLLLTEVRERAK